MGSIVLHHSKQLEAHLVNSENCLQWYYERPDTGVCGEINN